MLVYFLVVYLQTIDRLLILAILLVYSGLLGLLFRIPRPYLYWVNSLLGMTQLEKFRKCYAQKFWADMAMAQPILKVKTPTHPSPNRYLHKKFYDR